MRVRKRDGTLVEVQLEKIVERVRRAGAGLGNIDPLVVATRTISGLFDGATTVELDEQAVQTAAALVSVEPEYSRLAANLLAMSLADEVQAQGTLSFGDSVRRAAQLGLLNERMIATHTRFEKEAEAILARYPEPAFEYFGLRTLSDRYLLRDPISRARLETPSYFFMRVSLALAESIEEAEQLFAQFNSLRYLPSSPTLFNSGTQHEQLSSCFLLDSPEDDLGAIYSIYGEIAQLSKYAGGIGLAFHKVRSRGSLIKGTNGHSNGIVPWLKTLDSSVAAVNQGGRRKGACCVYLETWHADIDEFLELRENTGDPDRRTYNLNLANWIPDLFMKRVGSGQDWSLFDPKITPHLSELYGEEFEVAYEKAEADGLAEKTVSARTLYSKMMKNLAETGNGWMTFKDASNAKANQTALPGNRIHLSNLCTEILEVNSKDESSVCNLGSINLSEHLTEVDGALAFDWEALSHSVSLAVVQLDRVIDRNFYPTQRTETSNSRWRPIGLGLMGLQDVFFKMGLNFDSQEALKLSTEIQETVYFHALTASVKLAKKDGAHESFKDTRAANGEFQFELWGLKASARHDWEGLRSEMVNTGLRNSLTIAIAPTATIASIAGCYECIEPQVSNLFKRETLSGDFLQINRYLVAELKRHQLWDEEMRESIKRQNGSIQGIERIPAAVRELYRTAWELSMRTLVDLAAARGPFIDQSQSLNLFVENPEIGKISSMYMYAWKKGIKTTYYLRSRPATQIAKTTVSNKRKAKVNTVQNGEIAQAEPRVETEEELAQKAAALACSLENPESCEACQ
jgi:ribonucleoside-diphosphate reductase alpha chain